MNSIIQLFNNKIISKLIVWVISDRSHVNALSIWKFQNFPYQSTTSLCKSLGKHGREKMPKERRILIHLHYLIDYYIISSYILNFLDYQF